MRPAVVSASQIVRCTDDRALAPALLAAVFAVSLVASVWSWLSESNVGSPVNVGAVAVVAPGGAGLVDDRATRCRIASDQTSRATLSGLDLLAKYSAHPISAGSESVSWNFWRRVVDLDKKVVHDLTTLERALTWEHGRRVLLYSYLLIGELHLLVTGVRT